MPHICVVIFCSLLPNAAIFRRASAVLISRMPHICVDSKPVFNRSLAADSCTASILAKDPRCDVLCSVICEPNSLWPIRNRVVFYIGKHQDVLRHHFLGRGYVYTQANGDRRQNVFLPVIFQSWSSLRWFDSTLFQAHFDSYNTHRILMYLKQFWCWYFDEIRWKLGGHMATKINTWICRSSVKFLRE